MPSFDAAEIALGVSFAAYIAYFDRYRRKRNDGDYDRAFVVSNTEADELHAKAMEFLE